jgi:hypothetical protein
MMSCERCGDWPEGMIGNMMTDLQKATLFISVNEALPSVNKPVLVALWHCKHKYGIALWDGENWWTVNEERMPKYAPLAHISHWMELPLLPKHDINS